jgi:hypothetical protein
VRDLICCCKSSFCADLRRKHMFGSSLVQFPAKESKEYPVWLNILEIDPTTVQGRTSKHMKVGVWHFHDVDYLLVPGPTPIFNSLVPGNTRHDYGRARASNNAPPRPTASAADVRQSQWFESGDRKRSAGASFSSPQKHHSATKKKTKPAAVDAAVASPGISAMEICGDSVEYTGGRPFYSNRSPIYKPLFGYTQPGDSKGGLDESGITTSEMVQELTNHCIAHTKKCTGFLSQRRRDIHVDKHSHLTLQIKYQCKLKCDCKFDQWVNGEYIWHSSPRMYIGKTDSVTTVAEVKYCIAATFNPALMSSIELFVKSQGLMHPSRKRSNFIRREAGISDYVFEEKKKIEQGHIDRLKEREALTVSMDTGFNGVRNAEGGVCCAVIDGIPIRTLTDTKTPAAQKELKMSKTMLDDFATSGLDIATLAIDENQGLRVYAESKSRTNATNVARQSDTVEVAYDVFHRAKTMDKHVSGAVTAGVKSIKSLLSKHSLMISTFEHIILLFENLSRILLAPSVTYFQNGRDVLGTVTPETFKFISSSPASMLSFLLENKLTESSEAIDNSKYAPIVEAHNKVVDQKDHIRNISEFKIKSTTRKGVLEAVGIAFQTLLRAEHKGENSIKAWTEYLYGVLPDKCKRGKCFACFDVADALERAGKSTVDVINSAAGVDATNSALSRESICEGRKLFGKDGMSSGGLNKMKEGTLKKLAVILKFEGENADKETLRKYCASHYYLLYTLEEDVELALAVASKKLDTLKPSLKRHLKTIVRCVNKTWGPLAFRHLVGCIHQGVRNFSRHWCNDHSACRRHIWYTGCSNEFFKPDGQYVVDTTTGNGPRCNRLVVPCFQILFDVFLTSSYVEETIWRLAYNHNSTRNESYMHSVGMYIPKSVSMRADAYERREAVCYLNDQCNSAEKNLMKKVLSRNKHAPDLVATAGQKMGTERAHIIKATQTILGFDKQTMLHAAKGTQRIARRLSRRAGLVDEQYSTLMQDDVATNIGLLPSKGCAAVTVDGLFAGTPSTASRFTAMPVTPYPCMEGSLLFTPEAEKLYVDVLAFNITFGHKKKRKCGGRSSSSTSRPASAETDVVCIDEYFAGSTGNDDEDEGGTSTPRI